MAINMQRAKTLCTASEYELVRASGKREIGTLTPARLRQKVSRARKLRDKYRSLAARQTGEMRGKRAPRSGRPAADNRNTLAKAELFQETLDRFEEALAATGETPAAAPAHKKVTRRRSKSAAGDSASPTMRKTSKKASKKVRKKASKKTAKKSKKKAPRKKATARKATGAAALRSSAGSTGKKAARKKSARKALPSRNPLKAEPAPQAAVESGRKKTAKRSRAARIDKHFAESGIAKNVRGVAGKTRRNQAKRDSRG